MHVNNLPEVSPQLESLRAAMAEQGAAAFLTLDPDQQTWLTGFRALSYSRPIVLVVDAERATLIVPEIEERHAGEGPGLDRVLAYAERPGTSVSGSHLEPLDELLAALPAGAPLAVDEQRLPLAMAERLREGGRELLPFAARLRDLQEVKHPHEVEAVRRAGELVAIGVRASLDACQPGVSELEIDGAGASAILAEVARLGGDSTVEFLTMTPSGADRSILPHVFSSTRRLEPGDVLIHTRQLAIDGYRAELERTAFVGPPSERQAHAFETMLAAQQAAVDRLGPGVPAAEVDAAARAAIDRGGYGEHAIHRTGHGIAVSVHEHPHLRFDNPQELRSGMVLTIEPGFYVPGLGGFRHSDTWLVTEDGAEPLTDFPRSLEELVVGV